MEWINLELKIIITIEKFFKAKLLCCRLGRFERVLLSRIVYLSFVDFTLDVLRAINCESNFRIF